MSIRMFGLTHICAIDGYSGKIVGFVLLPVKNNILIYQYLYMLVMADIQIECKLFYTLLLGTLFTPMDYGTRLKLTMVKNGT